MACLVLGIIVVAILWFLVALKIKSQKIDLKSEQVEFDTQRTVSQIANILRSFNAEMEKLEGDALSGVDEGPVAAIEISMTGRASFGDAFKHFGSGMAYWEVQVYVYELGNKRHVVLVAVGEDGFGAMSANYAAGNQYYNLKFSRDYMDKIAQALA